MPDDRKHVCLYGPDTGYLETLASDLEDVVRPIVVTALGDIDSICDALIWRWDQDAPPTSLDEIAAEIPTLAIADDAHLIEAVDMGVRGFLPTDADLEEVRAAILTIAEGGAVVPSELLGKLLRHVVERRRSEKTREEVVNALTSRELEVYNLAVRGARRDEIAGALFISPDTVRTHLQRVYRKLGVHSQTELMSDHGDVTNPDGAGDK